MARHVHRWITGPAIPAGPGLAAAATRASGRCHGSLDSIIDSERRALRPIGISAREAADWTDDMLSALFARPGVRIFQGVRSATADLPRIPHAISAGREVVLIESVAWPPGRYVAAAGGRIYCDGTYTGQSVRQLMTAVRDWREALPYGHRVTGLVVVHPCAEGHLKLPRPATRAIAWAQAADAVTRIRARLPRRQEPASMQAVAALAAATAEEEKR